MKSRILAVVMAGTFSVFSGASVAEDGYQGTWYAVPGIGIMHTDSDLKAEDNSPVYSLRLGKEISEHWDVQLGLSHSSADEDSSTYNSGEYRQTLLGLDALYIFSRDKFRPFLLAGLGVARNKINYDGPSFVAMHGSHTSWMANVGAGFQYLITDNIGLQADLRYVWSKAEARTRDSFFNYDGWDSTVGNTLLSLGLVFRFPAPKPAAVAPVEAVAPAPMMAEIAPYDEALPPFTIEPPEPEEVVVYGPDKPVFEKMTLQAEVLFAFDKSELKDEGKNILDAEVTEKMKAYPEVELVLITGHTDRIGSDSYNQKLSERRAAAVKSYLMSQGIEENRLHNIGKGETEPVVDCNGVRGKKLIQCLQPNRRVVVEIEVQSVTPK